MFNSVMVEVAIGLILFYLLISLLATALHEFIAGVLSSRGVHLKAAIRIMLDEKFHGKSFKIFRSYASFNYDDLLTRKFFNHPLFKRLSKGSVSRGPSYIKSGTFVKILIECIEEQLGMKMEDVLKKSPAEIREMLEASPLSPELKEVLLSYIDDAKQDFVATKIKLEEWFNETMDRASGWYKKNTHRDLIIIGLVMAAMFNADTFQITKELADNPAARTEIVMQAEDYIHEKELQLQEHFASQDSLEYIAEELEELRSQVKELTDVELNSMKASLGLGWEGGLGKGFLAALKSNRIWGHFLGWFLTSLAISLGAPFWFDLLKRMFNIRNAGTRP